MTCRMASAELEANVAMHAQVIAVHLCLTIHDWE